MRRVCVRERYEESACVRLSVCVCVCIYIYTDGASVFVRLSVSVALCVRVCVRIYIHTTVGFASHMYHILISRSKSNLFSINHLNSCALTIHAQMHMYTHSFVLVCIQGRHKCICTLTHLRGMHNAYVLCTLTHFRHSLICACIHTGTNE